MKNSQLEAIFSVTDLQSGTMFACLHLLHFSVPENVNAIKFWWFCSFFIDLLLIK